MRTVEVGGPGVHLPVIQGAAYLPLNGPHERCRLTSMSERGALGGHVSAEIEWAVAEDLIDHVSLLRGHCRSFHGGEPGRVPRWVR
jgi:hypothetical protein